MFLLGGCGLTREKYVEEKKSLGFANTRGRIVLVENLSSNKIEPLSDGTAVTVTQGTARVTVLFDNKQTQVFDAVQGTIIVFGSETDGLLHSQLHQSGRY